MKFDTIFAEGLGITVKTTKGNIERVVTTEEPIRNLIFYLGEPDTEAEYEAYMEEVWEQEKYNYM